MNSNEKSTLSELFPLPARIKVHSYRFGSKPASALATVRPNWDVADPDSSLEKFQICWDDAEVGLSVVVQEHADGLLHADASSTDASLLNKGAVSVALVGVVNDSMIRKTIHFKVAEKIGCSGSADFGSLADAVNELGSQLRIIVLLAK